MRAIAAVVVAAASPAAPGVLLVPLMRRVRALDPAVCLRPVANSGQQTRGLGFDPIVGPKDDATAVLHHSERSRAIGDAHSYRPESQNASAAERDA